MTDSMDSLIRKLEEATGPSRELDAEVFCALKGVTFHHISQSGWLAFDGADGIGSSVGMGKVPRYTGSLDGAAMAIPDDHALDHLCEHWCADDAVAWKTGGATCKLVTGREGKAVKTQAEGRTLILALVLAALKAIQSSRNSDTGRKQT